MQEAEAALLPYVPLVAQLTGKHTTLERIRPLMNLLGNPQDKIKVIHIAGTSGKTSTAYYISAMLSSTGRKTGLTVSPHIDSVRERVQINGQLLDETEFCDRLAEFLDIIGQAEQRPSYFELLYAFAIWIFAEAGVDYAVVETGVGGLYDATNVVTRSDKICVITDIGFDHTHLLGHNLTDITMQKAGIIHEGNNVFMYKQSDEIMAVIDQAVQSNRANLNLISDQKYPANTQVPDYQLRNWYLAKAVYEFVCERDQLQPLTSQVLLKTQELQIPARMDVREIAGKTVIMDGAHNLQKMTTFINSFRHMYPDSKPTIMIALKDDKEYQELVPLLSQVASKIITTTFNTSQDLPVKSMDPEVLAQAFRDAGADNVLSLSDQKQALTELLSSDGKIAIICGSFYLLSQLRGDKLLKW